MKIWKYIPIGLLVLAGCRHPQARFSSSDATVEYNARRTYEMCLDVIAHNLANASTTAYKRCRIEFQEMAGPAATQSEPGKLQAMPIGAQAVCVRRIFSNGKIVYTGERLDIAIVGDGFFEVEMPDGSKAYTRDGAFTLGPDGHVSTRDGLKVQGGFVPIPQVTTSLAIGSKGMVVCSSERGMQSFQVQLFRFHNPSGLEAVQGNLFRETAAANGAEIGNPGERGFGTLAQGYLESSNVNIDEEMFELNRVRNACKALVKVASARQK